LWQRTKAEFVLVLVNAVFGSSFVARKSSYNDASPIMALGVMFVFALLPLLPYCARLRKEYTRAGVFVGTILFVSFALQSVGLNSTTPQKSAFITALYVKLVPVVSFVVYRKRPRVVEILGFLIALVGTFLLTTNGSKLVLQFGDVLTFGCTIGFASHIVALDHYSNEDSLESIAMAQVFWVAVFSLCTAWMFEKPFVNFTWEFVAAEAFNGVLATGCAFTALQWAMQYTTTTRTAFICALEPVFAALSSFLFFGEIMTAASFTGAGLILLGIFVGASEVHMVCDPPSDDFEYDHVDLHKQSDAKAASKPLV
jgi:drug/metabolite transporter (DMT)-like permease